MAKRMTDTEKWKKPFLKGLPAEYKLLWFYILDDCDHAGIWQVDMEVTQIRLGVKLSEEKARGLLKDKVVVFDNGTKWFIPDFIEFQYGCLTEKNKMYNPVISVLNKYNLMGHISPINGGKVQVQVKDKEKDIEGGAGETKNPDQFPTHQSFNSPLPEITTGSVQQLVKITHRVDLSADEVRDLFQAFKIQNLTGKKFYSSPEEVFSHFINWAKSQKYVKPDSDAAGRRNGPAKKQLDEQSGTDWINLGRKANSPV